MDKKEKEIGEMIKELGIEPEGLYHYDEQVLWVNTEIKLRMTILCATTNLIISDEIINAENFNKNTIKKFLKKIFKSLEAKSYCFRWISSLSFNY
ncbi:hypothetical protein MBCUT_12230 [Methanobrevibacter cuticularis]|uniref:Uncharacterized protein n=1 Tax=Methanobrevibacter cuticularis TaxID=47311 RepID=A0A166CPS9_9EURY|nr:hypothetical protein [Methanobrevibacter cuticularis]KZX15897.1 hypothetical protein MBCUT_12230 [Methanobrevibacter cuticularis]